MNALTEDLAIQQMIQQAKEAKEPGAEAIGKSVEKIDDSPFESTIASITSAGYVIIYDTQTGEPRPCNRNMLPVQLKKKRSGKPAFTLVDPGFRPRPGTYRCFLHPSMPERAEYDQMGLPVCPKATLPSPFQREQHMKTFHPAEWANLESARLQREKEAERNFQRALMARLSGDITATTTTEAPTGAEAPQATEEAPLYVSPHPKRQRK